MDRFLVRALVAALGLWIADALISGISFDSAAWLLTSAVVLGVINAIVRPLALILTLPITLVTLGLFILVLNAGMLGLASWVLPGFHVAGFWPAFWGAIVVSLVSGLGSWFFGPRDRIEVNLRRS
ncbi:MAG: phage holin family protein [Gammaproteobacteria bacterium]|nr:phage holin family protein [Gammaproteobacteria bacterium]